MEKINISKNGSRTYSSKISETYSFTYDDISLLPDQISEIEHRAECDTSVDFLGINLFFIQLLKFT